MYSTLGLELYGSIKGLVMDRTMKILFGTFDPHN